VSFSGTPCGYLFGKKPHVQKLFQNLGVRIVEFESNELELDGERVDAEVELWDCSGDRKFESCWSAIRHGTNGAILVVNPEQATGEQLLLW
jgi:intraflagellar transport protein 22